MNLTMCTL
jgi:hypothetical protein